MTSNNAKDYFELVESDKNKKKKNVGKIILLGAAVSLVFGLAYTYSFLLIAIPLIIVSGVLLTAKDEYVSKISAREYDREVGNMMSQLRTDPREYVGLDSSEVEEIDPISFEGYKFIGASKVRKDNEDGLWRSDLYEKATVYFTRNEVHIYKVFLSVLTGKTTETTDVLFYDDIVSVSTKNEVEKIGKDSVEYISINLVSKGGNSMSIAIKGNEDRQKSINAMRALIKEKKTQQ